MKETVEHKARRLLDEGRVTYSQELGPDGGHVFEIDGDHGVWNVTVDRDGGMLCNCPAMTTCSHLVAVKEFASLRLTSVVEADVGESGPSADAEPTPISSMVEVDPSVKPEIVPVADPKSIDLVGGAPVTYKTIELIAETEAVPKDLRGRPAAVFAAILAGQAWNLHPLEALRLVDVIEGRISPSGELYGRLYRSAGHSFDVIESTVDKCVLEGTRGDDGTTMRVEFTAKDADRAELSSKANWKRYPSDMLYNRALVRLVRRHAPDSMRGAS